MLQAGMKSKFLVCFGLSVTILTLGSVASLAQIQLETTKQSRQTLQRLPNGNYFYGRSRSPAQADVSYLVFRKSGSTVTGLSYVYRGEGYCFKGTVSGNNINNITREYVELGLGSRTELRRGNPINLSSYNRLNFNQIPADSNARRRLPECIRLFSNTI